MPVGACRVVNGSCKQEKAPVIWWMTEAQRFLSKKGYTSISPDPLECKGVLV